MSSSIETTSTGGREKRSQIHFHHWDPALEHLVLQDSQCHLFLAHLEKHQKRLTDYEEMLSAEEQQRATRFARRPDRDRFVICRGLLRRLLAQYTGLTPKAIRLACTSSGKPMLDQAQNRQAIHFSLSHRQDMALYAFACHFNLGVDIELVREEKDALAIAKQQFNPEEYQALSHLPTRDQSKAFYSYWTCKEAYIKARGIIDLNRFSISLHAKQSPILYADTVDPSQVGQWTFHLFDVDAQHRAALALQGSHLQLSCWLI